jgi:hypothetical protein
LKNQDDNSWLSNVEIMTHSPHLRPLWASPQFTFKTYRSINETVEMKEIKKPTDGNDITSPALFNEESHVTRRVEVEKNEPVPFRQRFELQNRCSYLLSAQNPQASTFLASNPYSYANSDSYNEVGSAPFAPPISEDLLKGIL